MRHVGRVLPRAVDNAEVLRAARAASALRRWDEAVGPILAEKSVPDRYDKGTVWVATQGSAWAQELRLMKPLILERLEAMGGERGMFLDVRFGVRPPRPNEELRPEATDLSTADRLAHVSAAAALIPPLVHEAPTTIQEPKIPLRDIPEPGMSIRERAARRLANWPKGE